ncbi:hypothetical protein HLV40_12610 [Chromohalobacter salexigens]|nr:hypothetical protein [Chromohalobacter salexigens]
MSTHKVASKNNLFSYRKPGSAEWNALAFDSIETDSEAPPWLEATDVAAARVRENKSYIQEILLKALQLPNLSFFAGSGTSLAEVGGPSMWDLWRKSMFLNPDAKEGDEEYRKLSTQASEACKKVKYDQHKNPNIEQFLSQCDAYLSFDRDEKILEFTQAVKKVILHECSSFINKTGSDISSYQSLIQRLARRRVRDPRLKVFTTNYDMCFETAASNLGMVVVDGFSYARYRKFDGKYFNYDIVRREEQSSDFIEGVFHLYKLHGSVSWERSGSDVYENPEPKPQDAALIYPAKGKYQQAFIQPHLELLSRFLESLRQPNSCLLISGFGFNDDHLSEPIVSAIKSNPSLKLIVADFKARSNIEKSLFETSPYWEELSSLSLKGYDIHFINSSFSQLVSIIPNLKALTPADQLAKAIKDIGGAK